MKILKNVFFIFSALFLFVSAAMWGISCISKKSSVQESSLEQSAETEEDRHSVQTKTLEWSLQEIKFICESNSITLECRKTSSTILLPVEELLSFLNVKYEVCGRCGNIFVFIPASEDVALIQWNSPYIDYRNREGRIVLKEFNEYTGTKTYSDINFIKQLKIKDFELKENECTLFSF